MRPIDLTPPDLRQGAQAPMRTGPLPYVLIGALVAVLLGVALLVMTGNEVSEREDEVATLKREDAAAKAEARRLARLHHLAQGLRCRAPSSGGSSCPPASNR